MRRASSLPYFSLGIIFLGPPHRADIIRVEAVGLAQSFWLVRVLPVLPWGGSCQLLSNSCCTSSLHRSLVYKILGESWGKKKNNKSFFSYILLQIETENFCSGRTNAKGGFRSSVYGFFGPPDLFRHLLVQYNTALTQSIFSLILLLKWCQEYSCRLRNQP
jgi:hypothetical protein